MSNRIKAFGFPVCYFLHQSVILLTRASAVVYLKNRITKGWSPAEEHSNAKPIPEDEKPTFRNRVVPLLANSPPQIRAQLIPTLQKILTFDFPAKWPEFLDITVSLLQANDANSVFAGVQCLLAVCRVYRFKVNDTREDFDKVVGVTFPLLLNIGNGLVNEESIEAGEMLRTLLKAYKHAIYVCPIAKIGFHHADNFSSNFQCICEIMM
jgi:importin-7